MSDFIDGFDSAIDAVGVLFSKAKESNEEELSFHVVNLFLCKVRDEISGDIVGEQKSDNDEKDKVQ